MNDPETLHFVRPEWLWLATAIVPVALLTWWRRRRSRKLGSQMLNPRLSERLLPGRSPWSAFFRSLLHCLAFVLFVAALAQPRWGIGEQVERATGRDIFIAIDTSYSMLAEDVSPNRLEQARLLSFDLLESLPDDRIGIIAFAGTSFLLTPLATDHRAVVETIQQIDVETIPHPGTHIASVIQVAIDGSKDEPDRNRALILLSDGEDWGGELEAAAVDAKAAGLSIFGIGIGTETGGYIPDPNRPGDLIRDSDGITVTSRLEMESLETLGDITGGAAFRLGDGPLQSQLQRGLARIDQTDFDRRLQDAAIDRYQWPLSAGILLLLSSLCLSFRHPRPQPGSLPLRTAKTGPATAAIALTLFLIASTPHALADETKIRNTRAAISAGIEAANNENYAEATHLFGTALADDHPEVRFTASYNLGTTLYEKGLSTLAAAADPSTVANEVLENYHDALDHLNYALSIQPTNEHALNNKTLVNQAIEELMEFMEKEPAPPPLDEQDQPSPPPEESEPSDDPATNDEEDDSPPGTDDQEQEPQPGDDGDPSEDTQPGEEDDLPDDATGDDPSEPRDGDPTAGDQAAEGDPSTMLPGDYYDEDGNIRLPDDPVERARVEDWIRENLRRRADEDLSVRPIPHDPPPPSSRKTW